MDLEASPEAMTRGTVRHADHLLLVAEPYFKSMETARRYHELGSGLDIPRVSVVGNKLRPGDDEIIEEFCAAKGYELIGSIPFEPAFQEAERTGRPPFEHGYDSPGGRALRALAEKLMNGAAS
jgi:CO dehydrogenase maturation factor